MGLTKPQSELLEAMKAGVVVHYMRYMGRYCPVPYYFRSDTNGRCTKQAEALLKRGLVTRVNHGNWGEHKLIYKGQA